MLKSTFSITERLTHTEWMMKLSDGAEGCLAAAQFDGLVAGYQDFASPQEWLSEAELFLLNADGDLIDLSTVTV